MASRVALRNDYFGLCLVSCGLHLEQNDPPTDFLIFLKCFVGPYGTVQRCEAPEIRSPFDYFLPSKLQQTPLLTS